MGKCGMSQTYRSIHALSQGLFKVSATSCGGAGGPTICECLCQHASRGPRQSPSFSRISWRWLASLCPAPFHNPTSCLSCMPEARKQLGRPSPSTEIAAGWYVLSIAVMGPKQGLISCLSGCRIFNRDTVCKRTGFIAVEEPRGGILSR